MQVFCGLSTPSLAPLFAKSYPLLHHVSPPLFLKAKKTSSHHYCDCHASIVMSVVVSTMLRCHATISHISFSMPKLKNGAKYEDGHFSLHEGGKGGKLSQLTFIFFIFYFIYLFLYIFIYFLRE